MHDDEPWFDFPSEAVRGKRTKFKLDPKYPHHRSEGETHRGGALLRRVDQRKEQHDAQ